MNMLFVDSKKTIEHDQLFFFFLKKLPFFMCDHGMSPYCLPWCHNIESNGLSRENDPQLCVHYSTDVRMLHCECRDTLCLSCNTSCFSELSNVKLALSWATCCCISMLNSNSPYESHIYLSHMSCCTDLAHLSLALG